MTDGLRFTISVDGEVQLDRMLSRFGKAMDDMSPFFKDAEERLGWAVSMQFENQGQRSGGWAPLSPRYAAWKLTHYGGKPLLQLSGDLKDSFRTLRMTALEFAWGTQIGYAIFHQRGTVKMPQRKVIALTDDDRRSLMKALQYNVVKQVKS